MTHHMTRHMPRRTALAATAVWLAAPLLARAQPATPDASAASAASPKGVFDTSGVHYPELLDAPGARLLLNGAGTRWRGPFRVYSAGLYLSRKARTLEQVLAAPGPKLMRMQMLREVDSADLGRLFIKGVEDNMDRNAFAAIVPGLVRMGQLFAEHRKLVTGDTFQIEWRPGVGTLIGVKGQAQGEPFREPEFFAALLRIWLGPNPADGKLKDALLGTPPS